MSGRPTPAVAAGTLAGVAALVAPLFIDSPTLVLRATHVAVFAVAFVGLHILSGRLGLVSIGHGAYVGIGGVAAAHAIIDVGLPYLLAPLAAALAAGLFGALIAVPSLRLPGTYFALLTLAVAMALPILLRRIDGPLGITVDGDLVPPAWTGLDESRSGAWQYLLVVLVGAAAVVVIHRALSGRFGRALVAVRDQPRAAASFGIHVSGTQLAGVMLATGVAGFAGGLRVYATPYVSHQVYPFDLSLAMFALMVAFGADRLWTAIPSAVALVMLPELLNRLGLPAWEPIVYGVALLVMTRVSAGAGLATVLRERSRTDGDATDSAEAPPRLRGRRGPWELA